MYTPQSLAFYSSNSGSGWCMHDPKFLKRSSKNIQSNQHMNLQSRGQQLVFKTSGVWIWHAMPILIHILHLQIIYYINVSSVYLIKKELKIKIQTIYWNTWQVHMGFVRGIELQVAWRCTEWKRATNVRAWHVPISCFAYEQMYLIVTFMIHTNLN